MFFGGVENLADVFSLDFAVSSWVCVINEFDART